MDTAPEPDELSVMQPLDMDLMAFTVEPTTKLMVGDVLFKLIKLSKLTLTHLGIAGGQKLLNPSEGWNAVHVAIVTEVIPGTNFLTLVEVAGAGVLAAKTLIEFGSEGVNTTRLTPGELGQLVGRVRSNNSDAFEQSDQSEQPVLIEHPPHKGERWVAYRSKCLFDKLFVNSLPTDVEIAEVFKLFDKMKEVDSFTDGFNPLKKVSYNTDLNPMLQKLLEAFISKESRIGQFISTQLKANNGNPVQLLDTLQNIFRSLSVFCIRFESACFANIILAQNNTKYDYSSALTSVILRFKNSKSIPTKQRTLLIQEVELMNQNFGQNCFCSTFVVYAYALGAIKFQAGFNVGPHDLQFLINRNFSESSPSHIISWFMKHPTIWERIDKRPKVSEPKGEKSIKKPKSLYAIIKKKIKRAPERVGGSDETEVVFRDEFEVLSSESIDTSEVEEFIVGGDIDVNFNDKVCNLSES